MPFALEITARDFAFAAGHRLTAISLMAGTLNSVTALSIAVASSAACTVPSRTALAATGRSANPMPFPGHLAFQRIARNAVPEISPEIKATFRRVWLERKNMALSTGSPSLLRRALRRLLPAYTGPATVLYRGATLDGWCHGVSWSADIEIARRFRGKEAVGRLLILWQR